MRYSDFKKKIAMQYLLILLINCSSERVQIDKLEGYWKIEFVYQNGEKFTPKLSKSIFDHYQIQYPKGFLNKVTLEQMTHLKHQMTRRLLKLKRIMTNII